MKLAHRLRPIGAFQSYAVLLRRAANLRGQDHIAFQTPSGVSLLENLEETLAVPDERFLEALPGNSGHVELSLGTYGYRRFSHFRPLVGPPHYKQARVACDDAPRIQAKNALARGLRGSTYVSNAKHLKQIAPLTMSSLCRIPSEAA